MGIRILVSNDDGWDKPCLRALYQELTNAGHDVVLSAPLIDNSGKGMYIDHKLTAHQNTEVS